MHRYVNIFLLVFIFCSCSKQESHSSEVQITRHQISIDTLLLELTQSKEDTNKVNLLNALSSVYSRIKFNEALKYGKQGLALAEKLNWKRGMAQSNQTIGSSYFAKSDFLNARTYFSEALKLYEQSGTKIEVAGVLIQLGEVYYGQADYSKALEYSFKALKLFEEVADKKGTALALGRIGMVYFYLYEPKTLDYLNKALEMNTALGNKSGIAENLRFIGNVYNHRLNNHAKALEYYLKALHLEEELGDKTRIARNFINIGIAYGSLKDHFKELDYKFRGLQLYRELGEKSGMANALGNLGWSYFFIGTDSTKTIDPRLVYYHIHNKQYALKQARAYMDSSQRVFAEIGEPDFETYFVISQIDSVLGNYKDAYNNYRKSVAVKELMYGSDKTKSIAQMQMQYEYDKKEIEAKAEQERKQIVQRNIRNTIIGGLIATLVVLVVVFRQRNRTLKEKKRSDDLLLNILPGEVAEELKLKGSAEAKHFDEVTVLFTDFKNFTQISEQLTAAELVAEIHACFKAFDEIIERYGIEKIKTIGDSYMCVGGLPVANTTHAEDVVNAGLDIQQFIANRIAEKTALGKDSFQIRIGIHTGPVVAGIVGIKKFAYDIWGDTVNTASRMESSGEIGKVNISGTTYALVKEKYNCSYRGRIQAKNKGEMDMYYVEGRR